MRILKVTQSYYPFLEKGGPAVKVPAIVRALRQRNHRVTVLTADWGVRTTKVGPEAPVRGPWGWQSDENGIEVVYLRGLARYRALSVNPSVFGFCRERLDEFDLVHIYGLYDLLGPAVAYFCRRRGIPYVVEPMGMFRPIVRNLWLKRLYHFLFGQMMLGGAQRLIATAEQERKELGEGGIPYAKVIVRRNGVEVPAQLPPAGTFRRQWGIPTEARVVLFLGRLVSKKGPEVILEAFAGWRDQAGNMQPALLVFAGPAERDGYRQRLEASASRLGLEGKAVFTGPLYGDAKWAAYRDADVFVLPSQNENFGNSAAEAVACGTPVIVTDRCGIAPLIDQRAGLVVPYDRGALQEGLAQLLDEETLRQRLRAGCTEVARALNWEEPLAVMETLYAELAGKRMQK
ncbi:MAG TPA: glycosyltransferase [Candidatus Acidoferrales bacterium]|nr:glycosyltransferase [Candidatus Acidoferrales bacterium]